MLVYITTIYIFIKTICLDTYMHIVVIIVIVDIIFSNKIKIKLKCMKYIYKHNVLCMYVSNYLYILNIIFHLYHHQHKKSISN